MISGKRYVFLFKQKTAYELRISDWSSDVCSSDLGPCPFAAEFRAQLNGLGPSFLFVHDHIVDLDPADPDRAWGVATAHAEVRRGDGAWQIGRAPCRARVCKYG